MYIGPVKVQEDELSCLRRKIASDSVSAAANIFRIFLMGWVKAHDSINQPPLTNLLWANGPKYKSFYKSLGFASYNSLKTIFKRRGGYRWDRSTVIFFFTRSLVFFFVCMFWILNRSEISWWANTATIWTIWLLVFYFSDDLLFVFFFLFRFVGLGARDVMSNLIGPCFRLTVTETFLTNLWSL